MAINDLGPVPLGSVIPLMWTSHDLATGANETMSALATTDIEVFKGVSMTQRSVDNGYVLLDTDGIDLDGNTGLNGISIDTGDNTDAGFFAAGSFYNVMVGPVTIDTQTVVNIHLATFRLVLAESVAGEPKVDVGAWLGTAAATPTVNGVPEVDVTHWIGTAAATPTVNGVPEVDVTHVAGSTTSVSTFATSIATLLADIGGIATAAADGDPTNTDLLFAYIKQLINILIGTAGIVAWPASAAPANAVSIAEGLRYLVDQVGVAGAGLTAADDAVIAAIPSAATNAAAVWDLDATAHQTQGTFGQAIGDPAADTGTIFKATVTDATGVTVGTDTATLLTRLGTPSDLGGGATVAFNLSDIEGQTDDIGVAGAGLSAIPWNAAWDAEVQSEATDALNAYDGPTHAEMTAELATADDAVLAAIAALNNLSAAAVNAEVVDALATDTYAEPGQGTPGATTTLALKIGYLYKAWRNKFTTDAGQYSLYNDDAATVDQKSALSDDGVTYEKGETATGP